MLALRKALLLLCLGAGTLAIAAQRAETKYTLDALVLDPSGVPVTNLLPEHFIVREGGEAQQITRVEPVTSPWSLVLMFDHNLTWLQGDGSRKIPDDVMWQSMGQAITRFLSNLNASDRMTMADFEDKVDVMLDWRNAKTGQVQEIPLNPLLRPPRAEKDVYGALRWAIGKLRGEKGRKAVIVFTDGRDGRLAPQWLINEDRKEVLDPLYGTSDTNEASEFVGLMDTVAASGVRFYFIAVTSNQPPDFLGRPISNMFPGSKEAVASYLSKVRTRMEKIAESSGGSVLYSQSPEAAIASYQNLYQVLRLSSRYTLEYTVNRRAGAPATRTTVEVSDRTLRVFPTPPVPLP